MPVWIIMWTSNRGHIPGQSGTVVRTKRAGPGWICYQVLRKGRTLYANCKIATSIGVSFSPRNISQVFMNCCAAVVLARLLGFLWVMMQTPALNTHTVTNLWYALLNAMVVAYTESF